MGTEQFEIIPEQSIIDWVGRKVTGSHNGSIELKNGTIVVKDGAVTGGKFTINMRSIKILDVKDPETNAQFAAHLAADDFFGIDKFPEATFVITSVKGSYFYGDLTIKDITKPISFKADVILIGNRLTASGKAIVNRTFYGMKFRSGNFFKNLGDTLIYDEFELFLTIAAKSIS